MTTLLIQKAWLCIDFNCHFWVICYSLTHAITMDSIWKVETFLSLNSIFYTKIHVTTLSHTANSMNAAALGLYILDLSLVISPSSCVKPRIVSWKFSLKSIPYLLHFTHRKTHTSYGFLEQKPNPSVKDCNKWSTWWEFTLFWWMESLRSRSVSSYWKP